MGECGSPITVDENTCLYSGEQSKYQTCPDKNQVFKSTSHQYPIGREAPLSSPVEVKLLVVVVRPVVRPLAHLVLAFFLLQALSPPTLR